MEPASPAFEAYLATIIQQRRYVKVQYFTELHELITLNALVTSLTTEGNDQLAVLSSGERIPLPRLVSIDGQFAPNYEGYEPYCETCDC